MAYGSTTMIPCPDLQGMLDENLATCNSSMIRESMPFYDFINSPFNKTGIEQKIIPGKGKIRQIELLYDQRILESNVKQNQPNPTCSASEKRGNLSQFYEMDIESNFQESELINPDDWVRMCRDNGVVFMEHIQRMMDAVIRRDATEKAADITTMTGDWGALTKASYTVNGSEELELRTTKTAGTTDPEGFSYQKLNRAINQSGFCSPPVVFSGTEWADYSELMQSGCCYDGGIDFGDIMRRFGRAVAYDYRIAAAMGGDEFGLLVSPGTAVLLNWARNEIYDQIMDETVRFGTNYTHTVVFDPRTGLKFDLNVSDTCGVGISIILTLTTKLISLPNDLFAPTDIFEGVKWINKIKVNNS